MDEVRVVAQAAGDLFTYANTNGSTIWGGQAVTGWYTAASDPGVTVNNGSENIAAFSFTGELDFYWEDSTGNYQKEVVAAAGVN